VSDAFPGLGPKSERPRLNPTVNLGDVRLTPTEAFVLSRVDGRTSYEEICEMTGLGTEATLGILQKLRREKLLVHAGEKPAAPPARPAPIEPVTAPHAVQTPPGNAHPTPPHTMAVPPEASSGYGWPSPPPRTAPPAAPPPAPPAPPPPPPPAPPPHTGHATPPRPMPAVQPPVIAQPTTTGVTATYHVPPVFAPTSDEPPTTNQPASGRGHDRSRATTKPKAAPAPASLLETHDDGSPVDPADLAIGPDLDVETKKRIVRLHRRLKSLKAHELLVVPPNAELAAIKRAYFAGSKEVHPDRYYGRNIGIYKGLLSDIFAQLTRAFEEMKK
jgi:hypothetical protein